MRIKLKINTAYGKIGDEVNVGPSVGERLVKSDQAERVDDAPPKRGPGRPPKMHPENKSMGA